VKLYKYSGLYLSLDQTLTFSSVKIIFYRFGRDLARECRFDSIHYKIELHVDMVLQIVPNREINFTFNLSDIKLGYYSSVDRFRVQCIRISMYPNGLQILLRSDSGKLKNPRAVNGSSREHNLLSGNHAPPYPVAQIRYSIGPTSAVQVDLTKNFLL
jgi:hypothetical protein